MQGEIKLSDLVNAVSGEVLNQKSSCFNGVGTDTRVDLTGHAFFALKGNRFDAHELLDQAIEKGAQILVVHKRPSNHVLQKVTVVLVGDTLQALQDLASYWRRQIGVRVLALTGSNGKTTTKEFAANILGKSFRVCSNRGSYNNHWGVPLTLLSADRSTEFVICEMGMNNAGEIEALTRLADPDIVTVTTVGRAHIENFAEGIEGIARAKEEIYLASRSDAIKVFNLDNPYTLKMRQNIDDSTECFSFSGQQESADVFLKAIDFQIDSIRVKGHIGCVPGEAVIPIFGDHNVKNLMAACALALAARMNPAEIWKAIPSCRSVWGRNQMLTLRSGPKLIFDAYNANPDSMAALLKNIAKLHWSGRKIGVFGQMMELGQHSPSLHEELGGQVARCGFYIVWFIGSDKEAFQKGLKSAGFNKKCIVSDTYEQTLALEIAPMLDTTDIVVVKGSRAVHLEKLLLDWKPAGDFSIGSPVN